MRRLILIALSMLLLVVLVLMNSGVASARYGWCCTTYDGSEGFLPPLEMGLDLPDQALYGLNKVEENFPH